MALDISWLPRALRRTGTTEQRTIQRTFRRTIFDEWHRLDHRDRMTRVNELVSQRPTRVSVRARQKAAARLMAQMEIWDEVDDYYDDAHEQACADAAQERAARQAIRARVPSDAADHDEHREDSPEFEFHGNDGGRQARLPSEAGHDQHREDSPGFGNDGNDDDAQQARQPTIAELQNQITELQTHITDQQAQITEQETQITEQQTRNNAIQALIDQLRDDNAAMATQNRL